MNRAHLLASTALAVAVIMFAGKRLMYAPELPEQPIAQAPETYVEPYETDPPISVVTDTGGDTWGVTSSTSDAGDDSTGFSIMVVEDSTCTVLMAERTVREDFPPFPNPEPRRRSYEAEVAGWYEARYEDVQRVVIDIDCARRTWPNANIEVNP